MDLFEPNTLAGVDFTTWRILSGVSVSGVALLYVYRFLCLLSLLKNDNAAIRERNDKLIYTVLIVLIPLGLGAFIYEYVANSRSVSKLFYIGFALAVIPAVILFSSFMIHETSLDTAYGSW